MPTSFSQDTPEEVQKVLEEVRKSGLRVQIIYGNPRTGSTIGWESGRNTGTISRSQGPRKVPILLCNSRSMGGAQILDNRILCIRTSPRKRSKVLYKHPLYKEDA